MPKTSAKAGPGNGKVNRSEAIREAVAQNPKASSKEIIAMLAERGLKVSPTLVYFVRSRQQHAKRKKKRELVAETSRKTAIGNPVEVVQRVKGLARDVGGIGNLKQLVDLLAE
jgi:arginine repressor